MMKKVLRLLTNLILISMTTFSAIGCSFFDDDHQKDKHLYQDEQWFNGTSSEYQGSIVNNFKIMSWKKYAPNWQEFIKNHQKLIFDDNSIIKVATVNYSNYSLLPCELVGIDLLINTLQISPITRRYEQKVWNIKFDYWFLLSVRIWLVSYAFFYYDNDNGNIYLTVHLEEYSRNATEGAHFKIILNNVFCP